MIVREFQKEDMNRIHELYQKFYSSYEYYHFGRDFKFACTVLDNDEIVAVGGIKPIVELAAICNKDASARKRREALLHILQTSIYSAKRFEYDELHVFSHDTGWTRKLVNAGFELTENSVLTLDV
jgi:hypothetical protein